MRVIEACECGTIATGGMAEASLDWRRAIIGALLERVEIAPATEKGRKPFDANRVRPVWRY